MNPNDAAVGGKSTELSISHPPTIKIGQISKMSNLNNSNNFNNKPPSADLTSASTFSDIPLDDDNDNDNTDKNSGQIRLEPSWMVYLASLSAHMASILLGCNYGWTAPAMEEMIEINCTSNDSCWKSPVLPNDTEKQLIASTLTIGALIGGLTCGFFIDRLGRRKTLMALGIPFSIGWIMIGFAKYSWIIIIGRIINGFAIGITVAVVQTYLTEISTPKIRGNLGMSLNFFVVFGMVYMDLIVIWDYHWNQLPFWSLIPTILLMLSMFFMPESPVWCINNLNDENESIKRSRISLKKLRTKNSDIEMELKQLLEHRKQIEIQKKSKIEFSIKHLKNRPDIYKPFTIGLIMLFFQQFCGINAIQFYMNDIFKYSGSNLSSKLSTLITNLFMLLSTIIGASIIDRFGRKFLLIISALGMGTSIGVLGFYYYQNPELGHTTTTTTDSSLLLVFDENIGKTSILPIICLSIFVSSFSLGIGPISWIIITEITPPQSIGLITTTSSIFAWLYTFLIVNETQNLFNLFKEYGTYWLFSSISFLCIIYVWIFLPETKEKTLEEIGIIFNY